MIQAMEWRFSWLALTAALTLTACGLPQPVTGPIDDDPNPVLNDIDGPCLKMKPGDADCDDDGLSDKCEETLGNNVCDKDTDDDGIDDGSDCPQNSPDCSEVKDDMYNQFINQYGPSLLAANGAFSGTAPPGTQIQVTEQRLRLVSAQNSQDDVPLCAGVAKPYLYLSIVGNVKICSGDPSINCTAQAQPARLDLCSKTLPFDPGQTVSSGTVFSVPANFDWEKGQAAAANGATQRFDTRLLDPKKQAEKSLRITVTDIQASNPGSHARKLRTSFKAAMKINGYILSAGSGAGAVGQIQSSNVEVSKNWQFHSSAAPEKKGALGIFAN